jgi:hypothetical protein
MLVKVRKLNIKGRRAFPDDPARQHVCSGRLKVLEARLHSLGRVVVTAKVLNSLSNTDEPIAELFDAVLLWADEKKMRMRGFEEIEEVQYAQVWEIEFA